MVITVTLNPSIDKTIHLGEFKVGHINRAISTTLHPGGKGVNVSRALHAYGSQTHALLVCGELGDTWMGRALATAGISHDVIRANGTTRSNMTIVDAHGVVTKINESGIPLTAADIDAVERSIVERNVKGAWVVLAGRLNPGLPATTYRDLALFAKKHGARVVVDTSGDELKAALDANAVDLIKPNNHELAELVGRPLKNFGEVVAAAREVIARGVTHVLCSLGADGALLITESTAVHCEPAHPVKGTPVGAGDILLGIFLGAGADTAALKTGVAWSAASVPLEGTSIPTPAQASAVEVLMHTDINAQRTLVEVA